MTESKKKMPPNEETQQKAAEILKKVKLAANYCYNCNRCVNVCPLSLIGVFSPRNLISDINFLPIEEVLEKNNIWECLTCGQCTSYCPMTINRTGVNIPELILELRQLAAKEENQVERLVQCETHDGIFPLINEIMVENPLPPNKLGFLEEFGLRTKQTGDLAVFVGCLPIMGDVIYSFDVKYIDTPRAIIGALNEADIEPVVLNEKCCGHDILWSVGDMETFTKLAEYNVDLYRKAGVKTIITCCAEGYRTWKIDYPKVIKDFDFEVLHFTEYFLKEHILDNVRFHSIGDIKVTYHDACRLGRLGGKIYDAPREILIRLPGVELIEMKNIKGEALCCGVTAFSCCNEYTRLIRKIRMDEAIATGADYLVVPCPKCLTHFNCYISEPTLEEKNKIKIIDLAGLLAKMLFIG